MTELRKNNFNLEVAKGNVPNHSSVLKFGLLPSISANTMTTVWDGGGTYSFLTSASKLQVVSSSTADTINNGVGMRTMTISGLDANYAPIAETVNLSGTTAIYTANSYLRTFRMVGQSAGASGGNLGSVVAFASGTANNQAQISFNATDSEGHGQTLMAVYTIPSGVTGYMCSFYGSLDKSVGVGTVAGELHIHTIGSATNRCKNTKSIIGINNQGTGYATRKFCVPLKISSRTDVLIEAVSSATGDVSAGFDIIEVDD